MSYLEYKHKIEFSEEQIKELVEYGKFIGIPELIFMIKKLK